jgi:pimeloyl-ACP methyl ester carboxylesterase
VAGEAVRREAVRIPAGAGWIEGEFNLPAPACGIVLFAHGSGSSRKSPRNQFVAASLQESGLGTLLMDLLTQEEELADLERGHLRFDIPFLADRLRAATLWLQARPEARGLPLGYFGASTGAAAALVAAADVEDPVKAIVSRGGRPDLAGDALERVKAPTLLIVGSRDPDVLALNRAALARLGKESKLSVVPGASHLFEEPGTLAEVARLASAWFRGNLDSAWAPSRADMLDVSVRGE